MTDKIETPEEKTQRLLALVEVSSIVMFGRYVAAAPRRTGGWEVYRWRADACGWGVVANVGATDPLVLYTFTADEAHAVALRLADEVGR